eukprot:TRINITY_DN3973_c0_g1_i1.p1 TRINITY_DN3973_c0_g1~~TRINITY_DN3973_c0_g1_i1.p1  ORF type:complete len:361 (-),score=87.26 TRINITY_DN3973_c0_g1_i1:7-1062(-)
MSVVVGVVLTLVVVGNVMGHGSSRSDVGRIECGSNPCSKSYFQEVTGEWNCFNQTSCDFTFYHDISNSEISCYGFSSCTITIWSSSANLTILAKDNATVSIKNWHTDGCTQNCAISPGVTCSGCESNWIRLNPSPSLLPSTFSPKFVFTCPPPTNDNIQNWHCNNGTLYINSSLNDYTQMNASILIFTVPVVVFGDVDWKSDNLHIQFVFGPNSVGSLHATGKINIDLSQSSISVEVLPNINITGVYNWSMISADQGLNITSFSDVILKSDEEQCLKSEHYVSGNNLGLLLTSSSSGDCGDGDKSTNRTAIIIVVVLVGLALMVVLVVVVAVVIGVVVIKRSRKGRGLIVF